MVELVVACIAFVGTHFLLSHPLRAPLAAKLGEGPFLGLYTLIAFATLAWVAYAFYMAPKDDAVLWAGGDRVHWITGTVVMLGASILFAGALVRNPAVPTPSGKLPLDRPATGVFAITRHPMMWAFALWGMVHIFVMPRIANIILSSAIIFLALGGAAAQDRKKRSLMGEQWANWQARTSFWPFARQLRGEQAWRAAEPRLGVVAAGTVIWLVATFAHGSIGAGVWRWIG